jgi:hypothetical protein
MIARLQLVIQPHSFSTCDSAALPAALEMDQAAGADPPPERLSTGDFSAALAALLGKEARILNRDRPPQRWLA